MTIPATSAAADLMTFLRESTSEAHRFAETRPFNRALAQATLPSSAWVHHLEQFRQVHEALDRRLEQTVSRRRDVVQLLEGRSRRPDLEADLAFWSGNPAAVPLQATRAAVQRITSATDDESLGMLYVLEGSTNGGRFLARSATRAFGLAPASRDGIRFLDPYGDEQPAQWAGFKAMMNALEPPPGPEAVRQGALAMFEMVGRIADEVWSPEGTSGSPRG